MPSSPHHSDGERVERCSSTDASRRRCEGTEGHDGFCFHRLGRNRSLVQWGNPTAEPPAGQEEESWPALTVLKHRVTDNPPGLSYLVYDIIEESEAEQFRDPTEPDFSVASYYPEGHPAVLSPDEAAEVIAIAGGYAKGSDPIWAIVSRLIDAGYGADYAGKEHHAEH